MNKRLKDNLKSEYFEAANQLRSKRQRRKIVAYVESYEDIIFWRKVLSNFENESRFFEIMLPSKHKLTRGKKSVLMNLLFNNAGQDMIACVDADYDWLMMGATAVSQNIISNPFVFHTYVYSIENYRCYAPSLHDVAVMVTLNDHAIFDFADYLSQFSQAIFPLFVWSIWHYRNNRYSEFTITDFNKIIVTGNFNMQNPYAGIAKVKRKVGRRIRLLQQKNPTAKASYLSLKEELFSLGITPDTTYLYIQGHHLLDNVVVPMLKKVSMVLRQERESEINRNAVHSIQRHNELSCYTNGIEDVPSMLRTNTGYMNSVPYQWLQNDIRRYLDTYQQPTDHSSDSDTQPALSHSTA